MDEIKFKIVDNGESNAEVKDGIIKIKVTDEMDRIMRLHELAFMNSTSDGKVRKNKSDKKTPINMESIEAIAKQMKQEVDDLYKNK